MRCIATLSKPYDKGSIYCLFSQQLKITLAQPRSTPIQYFSKQYFSKQYFSKQYSPKQSSQ
jgi:hypothetical protein